MAELDQKKKRKKSKEEAPTANDDEYMIKPEKTTPKLDTSRFVSRPLFPRPEPRGTGGHSY
jgi:hypothetical protein